VLFKKKWLIRRKQNLIWGRENEKPLLERKMMTAICSKNMRTSECGGKKSETE
jgi:hypothetical protein